MKKCFKFRTIILSALILLSFSGYSLSQPNRGSALKVGDQAILFKSVDQNMNPVDMADMIKGKPLVLLTGSCT